MSNLRQRSTAFVLALVIGTGMVMSSTPVYASHGDPADPRCVLLQRAIGAATEKLGENSRLVVYLQGFYDNHCK